MPLEYKGLNFGCIYLLAFYEHAQKAAWYVFFFIFYFKHIKFI